MRRYRDYASVRKAGWKDLSAPQLRRVMAGLFTLETESRRAAVRNRLRRRRLEAAALYRALHGPLQEDRFWVAAKPKVKRGARFTG